MARTRRARSSHRGVRSVNVGLSAGREKRRRTAEAQRTQRTAGGPCPIEAPARETPSPGRAPQPERSEKPGVRLFICVRMRPTRAASPPAGAVGWARCAGGFWPPDISGTGRVGRLGEARRAVVGVVLGVLASWRLGEPDTERRQPDRTELNHPHVGRGGRSITEPGPRSASQTGSPPSARRRRKTGTAGRRKTRRSRAACW